MHDHDANQDRARGAALFRELTGSVGERLLADLATTSPDLVDFIQSFAFGKVMSRPALAIKERERLNVGVLTALGYALPQLKLHIHGALNAGVSEAEVIEIILQMAVYAGFPAALNGMGAAKEVFAERAAARQPAAPPDRLDQPWVLSQLC